MSAENPILNALQASVIVNRRDKLGQIAWTEWRTGLVLTGGTAAQAGDIALLGPNGKFDPSVISGSGGAVTFDQIESGTNTSATMTVGTGASLVPAGSGVINATEINGIPITGSLTHAGQIPISQPGNATAVWADPLVQGISPVGTAVSGINPVLIGVQDSSGNLANLQLDENNDNALIVEVATGTPVPVAVALSVFPTLTANAPIPLIVDLAGQLLTRVNGSFAPGTNTTTGGPASAPINPVLVGGQNSSSLLTALSLDAASNLFTTVSDGTNVVFTSGHPAYVQGTVAVNGSVAVTGTFWPYTLGQQLAANSVPVILPSATITTLTPPTAAAIASAIVANPPTTFNGVVSGTVTANAGTGTFTTQDVADGSTGTAVPSKSVQIGGSDGTNLRTLSTDTSGQLKVLVQNTPAVTLASTTITGTVAVTQNTSPWIVAGGGTAGSAATGVVTVQGIAGGVSLPVTATIAATQTIAVTNVGTFAVQAAQTTSPWIIAGGGTAGTPGTAVLTVQGVSGGQTIPVTASIAASQTIAVTQGTASALNATVIGSGVFEVSATASVNSKTNPIFTAITDGTNVITAAISAWGVAPSGTEVMGVNANVLVLPAVTIAGSQTIAVTNTGTFAVQATQTTSPWIVAGGGTAGSPGTAVLTIQGVGSGTAVPVSVGSSPSVGSTGSTAPTSADLIGSINSSGFLEGASASNPIPTANIWPSLPKWLQGTTGTAPASPYTFPIANVGGDTLMVISRGAISAVTDTNGNAWQNAGGGGFLWYVTNCAPGNNTVTATGIGQAAYAEFSNVGTFCAAATSSPSGASVSAPSVTTTAPNALVVLCGFNNTTNSPAITAGSGYTLEATGAAGNNAFLQWGVTTNPATVTPTVSCSTSIAWTLYTIAFNQILTSTVSQGGATPNIGGAWPTIQTVVTNSTLGSAVFARTSNVFKTAQATASGNTALWTPTSGNKFRLMKLKVMVTDNAAQSAGGVLTIQLEDASTAIGMAFDVYVPAASISAPIGVAFDSGWIDLGNGYVSTTASNVLNINLSTALTSGNVRVIAAGCEAIAP